MLEVCERVASDVVVVCQSPNEVRPGRVDLTGGEDVRQYGMEEVNF